MHDFEDRDCLTPKFTVYVDGVGELGAGQIVHAVDGGGVLAMELKAAAAQGANQAPAERPYLRGRISGMRFDGSMG